MPPFRLIARTIHDISEQDGRFYMVMELVDGKPLNLLIPRKGMRLTEGLRVAVQVADALSTAQAAGFGVRRSFARWRGWLRFG